MSKSKLVKFKGRDFGIGLEWQEFIGKKTIIRNRIKDNLKKKKYDGFGVRIEEDKNRVQIGFSDKSLKSIPSLAKFLSEKKEFKNSLVILNVNDDQFWMCGITKNGLIENGSDNVYEREDFINALVSYTSLLDESDEFKIMISEENSDYISEVVGDHLDNLNVKLFDENECFSGNSKSAEINLIYNSSADVISQVSTLALAGAFITSGYFFLYLEDPSYHEIVNQELSISYYDNKNSYDTFVSNQDKKLSTAYESLAKKEIIENKYSAYSNEEIYNNIEELSFLFPIFLVEWELDKILYQNLSGQEHFSVSYKRIENSYGNTDELKLNIEKILKANNVNNYSIMNPNIQGDVININIIFKEREDREVSIDANKNEINKNLSKYEKELTAISGSIEGLENEVVDFSFLDKRFGSALQEKEDEILSLVDSTNLIFKKMKKEREKLNVEETKIDPNIISGSKAVIVNMIQSYSYYQWEEKAIPRKYPTVDINSKVRGEIVNVYAQSTNISVGDGNNLDIMGLNGLKNVLLSENLLKKPYIKINFVEFGLESEKWKIEGEYYEKI